jgi:lipid-A-disaccharide synthase
VSDVKKILVIAGEASGDRLAAHALKKTQELAHQRAISLELYGIGGNECEKAGMRLLHTDKEMSVVGFTEVIKRFSFFRKVFNEIVSLLDSKEHRPDLLFLVDYPGFNIRLAKEAKKRGLPVVYYVSPQVWAWKPGRIKNIVENTDKMLVIFPFEEEIYKRAGHKNVQFVGHPLVELIETEEKVFIGKETFAAKHDLAANKKWLLIFPGSRQEEIKRHLAVMVRAAHLFDKANAFEKIVVCSASLPGDLFKGVGAGVKRFLGSSAEIHELMCYAEVGILKSGTTTLEAGLMKFPGVICYRTSFLTYHVAKRLISLPYVGLINIVLGRKAYPELLQSDFQAEKIASSLFDVEHNRENYRSTLTHLHDMLRSGEVPTSELVARQLLAR